LCNIVIYVVQVNAKTTTTAVQAGQNVRATATITFYNAVHSSVANVVSG